MREGELMGEDLYPRSEFSGSTNKVLGLIV
jgi:hypothetical protein